MPRLLYGGALALALWLVPVPSPAQEQSEPPPVHSFDLDQQDSQIASDEAVLMDFFFSETLANDPSISPLPVPEVGETLYEDDFHGEPVTPINPTDNVSQSAADFANQPAEPLNQPTPDAAGAPLPPPVSAQAPAAPPLPPSGEATATESGSLGQSLPKPLWDSVPSTAPNNQGTYLSDAPAPQYDASQGQWMQLEVGQADSGGPSAAAAPAPRGSSVSTLPTVTGKIEPEEESAAPTASATVSSTGAAVSPPEAGANNQAAPATATATDRRQLRDLFADMLPAEGQGARLPSGSETESQPAAQSVAPTSGSQPAVGSPVPASGSSILGAGGLLTTESYFGSAAILPPLTDKPTGTAAKPVAETSAAKPPATETKATAPDKAAKTNLSTPPLPPSTPAKTKSAAKQTGKKTSSAGKKSGQAKRAAQAVPPAGRVSLILINETGNERIGEVYRSVLSKMGYNIVSVGNKPSSGASSSRTIINYSSGARAKAQAVARHLPGQKSLVEAKKGEVLAADVMVFLK